MPVQKWSEQIWVVKLASDPVFTEDLVYLQQQAKIGGTIPDMVLDLTGVEHLTSTHLSELLRLRQQMVAREARLRLVAPPNPVWALFLTTGLDKVFEFTRDTSTALAELQLDE